MAFCSLGELVGMLVGRLRCMLRVGLCSEVMKQTALVPEKKAYWSLIVDEVSEWFVGGKIWT